MAIFVVLENKEKHNSMASLRNSQVFALDLSILCFKTTKLYGDSLQTESAVKVMA